MDFPECVSSAEAETSGVNPGVSGVMDFSESMLVGGKRITSTKKLVHFECA